MEPLADGLQISFFLCPALQEYSLPIAWIKPPEGCPLAIGEHEITHDFGVDGLAQPLDVDADRTRRKSD